MPISICSSFFNCKSLTSEFGFCVKPDLEEMNRNDRTTGGIENIRWSRLNREYISAGGGYKA